MANMLSGVGDKHEGLILAIGLVAFLTSLLFLLIYFGILTISLPVEISDQQYLFFFVGISLISGIMNLVSTLGFLNVR
jgi:hypothetical protein